MQWPLVDPPWPPVQNSGAIGIPWQSAASITDEQRANIIHNTSFYYILTTAEATHQIASPVLANGSVRRWQHIPGQEDRLRFWMVMGSLWDERRACAFTVWWCCDVRQAYVAVS